MEVQRTTTVGKSVVTDSIKLTYSISTKGEKKEILGEVRKDDEIVGRFNASNNGIIGFSLQEENNLSTNDINLIFQQSHFFLTHLYQGPNLIRIRRGSFLLFQSVYLYYGEKQDRNVSPSNYRKELLHHHSGRI